MGASEAVLGGEFQRLPEFRVSTVIARSARVCIRQWIVFLMSYLLVFVVPFIAITYGAWRILMPTAPSGKLTLPIASFLLLFATVFLVAMALFLLWEALVALLVFQDLRGESVPIGDTIHRALQHLVPAVLTSIVVGLIWMAGLSLLIVPGIVAFATFVVSIPACAVEGVGPFTSLSRSAALTKHHRWTILGLFGIGFVVQISLPVAVDIALPATHFGALNTAAQSLTAIAVSTFGAVVIAVIYHDLKSLEVGQHGRRAGRAVPEYHGTI